MSKAGSQLKSEGYGKPETKAVFSSPNTEVDGESRQSAVAIITDYFRKKYRPDFKRGNAIHTEDGQIVPMGVACEVPTSKLIAQLELADDAPTLKSGGTSIVNRSQLPGFFKKWCKVAWGDLLESLPDEDTAELGTDSLAADEFSRLVREAMLTGITLGDIIGGEGVNRVERISLLGWCQKFAKAGPWRSIRDYRCWCKIENVGTGGEYVMKVAIRQELFGQIKADRRLTEMGANTFTRRASKYGIGTSPKHDRPHGQRAVVLSDDFVADLTASFSVDEAPIDDLEI